MLSKKNSMVSMVTDEFLENRIILQKSVATIGFIWFFWFQKCILLYIFAQVFLVMRSIRSHISLFRLGFTPTLSVKLRVQYPLNRDVLLAIPIHKRIHYNHQLKLTFSVCVITLFVCKCINIQHTLTAHNWQKWKSIFLTCPAIKFIGKKQLV